ncbi:MAG TPA: CoA transferase [Candidatus Binataceae bacterium]|nr:CoA transferase [Candidatus Binataceae bacterium]
MEEKGLLSGIRVIDCATYIAGPAAATIMSDFGAEVIKIERPEGDQWRNFSLLPGTAKSEHDWCWLLTARNKKSLGLDLSRPAGREVLNNLVKTADVFVTNYQTSILSKFHLTWDDLRPLNDRLIYAHITGYGDTGDDAEMPAFDAFAYWARSGLMMSVTGRDGTPGQARPGMGDHPTASALFGAIVLGLYKRERTGRGTKVSTSLMASGAWANGCDLQAKFCKAEFPQATPGAKHPANPLAGGYISADGKIVLLALLDPKNEFPRLCAGLGMPELATDEMFSTNAARTEHAAELHALLQSQFESRTLAELRKIFHEFDVKWSPIPLLDDVVQDPQMRASQAVIDLELPSGKLETVNSPIFIEGSPKRKPAPAPAIGANTREVLVDLGYSEGAIEAMIKSGAALATE